MGVISTPAPTCCSPARWPRWPSPGRGWATSTPWPTRPYVMDWNLTGCLDTYPAIAAALGEGTDGLAPRAAAVVAVDAVRQLARDLGIPERLRDVDVTREALPAMTRDAMPSGNG